MLTIDDIERLGIEKTAEIALELAWDGTDAVYISFDIDSVDCGFVPGTGWPEPGGFLPREALKLLGLVAKEGICGLEVVEVSPPYDTSDITALLGVARRRRGAGRDGRATASSASTSASSTSRSLLMHDDHHTTTAPDTAPATTSRRGRRRSGRRRIARRARPTPAPEQPEPDFDLVEAAFAEGFATACDPPASCVWPASRS